MNLSNETLEERLKVENWRRENFERLGFSLFDATTLAEQDELDWHVIERFMESHPSCTPELALKIVA